MSQGYRLKNGGRIDRKRPLDFFFDGRQYSGFHGDTLASALVANGVQLVGRSFKYHRPRGLLSAGAEEPNALVGLFEGTGRFTPNLRATQIPLTQGLTARSQNRWPSLQYDVGAFNDLLSPLFSAGFYYKTFMGPNVFGKNSAWMKVFEPIIRRAAGLGAAPKEADPDNYAQYFAHCDILIVGSGPAGLAAARSAGASGASVILCDESLELGGSLLAETQATVDGRPARDWLASTLAALEGMPNLRLMPRTQAFGYYAQNFVGLAEIVSSEERAASPDAPRERLWQVRAREVVLACGAIERPIVFPDNDRPGVMLADSARVYLRQYGAHVGARVAVVTAHDSAYRAALEFIDAGVKVAGIFDLRQNADGDAPRRAREAGLPIVTGAKILGVQGGLGVKAIEVETASGKQTVACDAVLMSGGWTPSVHLHSQSRGKVVWDEARGIFLPGPSVQRERSAGACNGQFGLGEALDAGAAAGVEAAQAAGFAGSDAAYAVQSAPAEMGGFIGDASAAGAEHAKAFVDFQNDVCAKDIRLAVREGMRSIEHVKRYTTTGMATDQGKTSNLNALAIAARALDVALPQVGLTTFRQPYTPVTFGAFAGASRGDLFDPIRRTAIHDWAEAQGAAFEDVSLWKRAWYFARPGESMHAAVERECRQTRETVGLFDASTLGKIEVVGPDAATFLERLYTNPWAKLEVGRCRYGVMLNEQGFVMDDGVVARVAADRFHVTTTTGGAPRVLHHMEDYLQTEFPDLKVWLTSTTEQWAVIAVQGPKSRELIAPFVEGIDISKEAMPHMSLRQGLFCGVPTRLMRVSFTGELGFEINIAPEYARSVWSALWDAGGDFNAVAYGTEAMHVMRAEKGYIIVGQDTDGTMTPADAGLEWAIGKSKKDFVGKRSLRRPDMIVANRKQLVGLFTEDPQLVLEEGAQVVAERGQVKAIGHVTSAYASPALGRSIALAVVEAGRSRMGQPLIVRLGDAAIPVSVTDPIFFDRQGSRLDG